MVKLKSFSFFTFLQAVAISAVNLNGVIPVTAEKYSLNFALKENPHSSNGVSNVIFSTCFFSFFISDFLIRLPLKYCSIM